MQGYLGVLGVQLDVWGGHVVGRGPIGKVLGLYIFSNVTYTYLQRTGSRESNFRLLPRHRNLQPA